MSTEYSHADLVRLLIRDQIADIRHARRLIRAGLHVKENQVYERECCEQLSRLFEHRHTVRLDRYGWPEVWK